MTDDGIIDGIIKREGSNYTNDHTSIRIERADKSAPWQVVS